MNNRLRINLRLLIGAILLVVIFGVLPFGAAAQGAPLADANTALMIGDYPTAIEQYTAALEDPDLKCDALYGLGVTYLRASQPEDADNTFTRYIDECERSFRVLVLRGQSREHQDRPEEALADYEEAMSVNPGLLDSYLYSQMAPLDPDQAVHYLRLATEAERHPEGKFALRQHLAEIYLLVGSSTSALAEYETILSEITAYQASLIPVEGANFDRNAELRAQIEYDAAQIELQNRQAEAGYARLQRIIMDFPETSSALPALIDLILAGQPVDLLVRMRINVMNENYQPVVGVLEDYLDDPETAEGAPAELHLLLGRAQRGLGDNEAALVTFERVRQQFPEDPAASIAALERAQTQVEASDYAGAVAAFTAVADDSPESPEAPEALLRAAQVERDFGDVENALHLYDQLGTRYPESEQAQDGAFEAGEVARDVDPARAADFFGHAGTAQGFVLQGKLLEQIGDSEAARRAWEQATATEPGSFFAIRGCELLNGIAPFIPSQTLEIPPITDTERQAAAQWVAQMFEIEGVSAELSPELAQNPMLQRGTELWAVGRWAAARAEFDALHKFHRDDPVAMLQLAFHYYDSSIYRSSLYAATRLVYLSEAPFTQIPRAILQLAYPFYYVDLFVEAAAEYDFDPLLVAAVVRQETSFDATATSPADARGLLQLLPSTAQDVANRLGVEDYSLDDLYRPIKNIPLGVYYLDFVREFQDGSIAGALLSYNAGPGAAWSWVSEAGGDIERLYENIAYDQTRQYLELIYHNYTVYRHLYGDGVPACAFEAQLAG